MIGPTPVILVSGNSAEVREAAIATMIGSATDGARGTTGLADRPAVILEGMPDGIDRFSLIASNFPLLFIARIAPGCPCCIGNLTMRVTLNRILRRAPEKLYISLATPGHHDRVREFLVGEPYDKLLGLIKDVHV